jgi:hypothetical protein
MIAAAVLEAAARDASGSNKTPAPRDRRFQRLLLDD